MAEILSLNPDLNTLLKEPLKKRMEDRSIADPFCRLLRACRSDAETAYVLGSCTASLLDALPKDRQQVWSTIDDVLDCFALDPLERKPPGTMLYTAKSPTAKGTDLGSENIEREPDDGSQLDVVAAIIEDFKWEANATADHKSRKFRHVPIGHNEFFDALKAAGYTHDFQAEFDKHLTRLMPLYVAPPQNRAPASRRETVARVRQLLDGMLVLWRSNRLAQDDLTEHVTQARLLEDADYDEEEVGDAAQAVLAHYPDHVHQLNLLAFDALYLPADEFVSELNLHYFTTPVHTRQIMHNFSDSLAAIVTKEAKTKKAMDQIGDTTANECEAGDWLPPISNGMLATCWLFHLATLEDTATRAPLENEIVAFAATLPLTLQPEILIPKLRYGLVGQWTHDEHNVFKDIRFPPALPEMEPKVDISVLLSMFAVCAYACGTSCEYPHFVGDALLKTAGIFLRRPTLAELAQNIVNIERGGQMSGPFRDGSYLSNALKSDELLYGVLLETLFDRVRDAPKSGERIAFEPEPNLWDPSTFIVEGVLASSEEFLDDENPPAIFLIAHAFQCDFNRYFWQRLPEYLNAIRACLKEELYTTAINLLCYLLVTQRTPPIITGGIFDQVAESTQADTYEFGLAVHQIAHELFNRVPTRPLIDALEIAAIIHRTSHSMDDDVDDYFTEQLSSVRQVLLDQVPQPDARIGAIRGAKGRLYEARLNEMTGSESSSWPDALRKRIGRIELDHDFSIGGHDIVHLEDKDDYAWAVSYFKVIEGMLRHRFCFLFDDNHRQWLEQANPSRKISTRYEQAPVRRLLEHAKRKETKYEKFISELRVRQIAFPDVVGFFREYMKYAELRNSQAHGTSTLREAEQVRRWVLNNIGPAMKILSIEEADISEIL